MDKKYVAYIGCYTFHGSSKGIAIMDVDVANGRFIKRKEIRVNNSSYLTVSTIISIYTPLWMKVWRHLRSFRTAI